MTNIVMFPMPKPAGEEIKPSEPKLRIMGYAMAGELENIRGEFERADDAISGAYMAIRELVGVFGHDGAREECAAIFERLEGVDCD